MMLSGLGVAGVGVYGNQLPPEQAAQVQGAQKFIQEHATAFIAVGIFLIVAGFVLNMVMAQRMKKRMMASMPMMGGMGGAAKGGAFPGMEGMTGFPGMSPSMQPKEVVKVRCPTCKTPQLEAAKFCADCGAAMIPAR